MICKLTKLAWAGRIIKSTKYRHPYFAKTESHTCNGQVLMDGINIPQKGMDSHVTKRESNIFQTLPMRFSTRDSWKCIVIDEISRFLRSGEKEAQFGV